MSDFDKEAEREKLREKYERDKAEREATQRMSDLLLKGATMTNAHCGTCGDPLFKENGVTFCPSCHGNPDAVQGTDLEAQPAEEAANEPNEPEAGDAGATGSTPVDAESDDSDDASLGDRARDRLQERSSTEEPQPSQTGANEPARTNGAASHSESRSARPSPAPDRNGSRRSFDGDLEYAHDSLQKALERFAAEAAAADDPRYAKECLEAAREASETLNTLR
ncbi:Sjogren's syndrome/scleroderma autoantigen 1 family protein [Natronobacterium texcoconense]|uniref:Sjogren's syndrome/scleroderma autoantigen 1 (Autoantigen p27) n=1 Tax=Natronobacterium texcoconense TaxID=1095778 RepID=A0A1H1HTW7_NATTX|nr:Sjogren's syndrome/scleroderma autoantigen 1 family protein [Natronobacterium texcoconense]SDR28578.1 Sjogren's syndrome/scleroderma autoantigen 1 (Autoantigen p27) [Natronobacterium texcoconense]